MHEAARSIRYDHSVYTSDSADMLGSKILESAMHGGPDRIVAGGHVEGLHVNAGPGVQHLS